MAIAIAMTSSIIATGLLAVPALLDVLLLLTLHCLKQCCPPVQDVDDPLQQWELEDTRWAYSASLHAIQNHRLISQAVQGAVWPSL